VSYWDDEATCSHLESLPAEVTPNDTGCQDCLAAGMEWVHLRLCLTCGRVACCDQSPGKHASAHSREVGHPVVRSFEAEEDWRWCYVDELYL
jgi:uncharacterized UBP type Zn finger protein